VYSKRQDLLAFYHYSVVKVPSACEAPSGLGRKNTDAFVLFQLTIGTSPQNHRQGSAQSILFCYVTFHACPPVGYSHRDSEFIILFRVCQVVSKISFGDLFSAFRVPVLLSPICCLQRDVFAFQATGSDYMRFRLPVKGFLQTRFHEFFRSSLALFRPPASSAVTSLPFWARLCF